MNTTSTQTPPTIRPIVSLSQFCAETGISNVTAWRWRQRGWLKPINICGRQYLTGEAVADFLRRSEAGEFATEHKVPGPRW